MRAVPLILTIAAAGWITPASSEEPGIAPDSILVVLERLEYSVTIRGDGLVIHRHNPSSSEDSSRIDKSAVALLISEFLERDFFDRRSNQGNRPFLRFRDDGRAEILGRSWCSPDTRLGLTIGARSHWVRAGDFVGGDLGFLAEQVEDYAETRNWLESRAASEE